MSQGLGSMASQEEIRSLISRLLAYEDRRMWDEAADLFTDDGVFDETILGVPLSSGREQVRAFLKGDRVNELTFLLHLHSGHVVTVTSETEATGFFNILFEGGLPDGSRTRIIGYFEDSYARVDGSWFLRTHKLFIYAPRERLGPIEEMIR